MDLLDEKKAGIRAKTAAFEEITHDCDVCGKAVTGAEQNASLRDIVLMCRSCGVNMGNLSGSLQRVASRFLMGNVL